MKKVYVLVTVAIIMLFNLQLSAQNLGFVEDFSDPTLTGWTTGGGNATLSQSSANNTMTIDLLKQGDAVWGHVTRNFDALDLTDAPYLSFEVSVTADVAFYANLSDGSIEVENQGSVSTDDGFKTIYIKVSKWEGKDWSNDGAITPVDPTNIVKVSFKFSHGQEYDGEITLRNIRIGSQAELEAGDSFVDDFVDPTLEGWSGDAGYTISQETQGEMKVNLVKVKDGTTEWGNLIKSFDAIDMTTNPYISVKIKADAECYLKVQPGNTNTGVWAEDNSSDVTIPVTSQFVEYTFKTTAWIGYTWPGPNEVDADPTNVNAVRFRMAHGKEFNGNIYLKELRVGAHAAPTELDFSGLESLITVAEGLVANAEEGTEHGQYEVGSIDLIQTVIDDANGLIGDQYTTQVVIDETYSDLETAVSVFSASKVPDPNAGKAVAVKVTQDIVIDGDANDAAWTSATEYAIDLPYALVQSNPIENEADLSGYWKTAWDEEYFYILVDINDENVSDWASVGNPWERDLIELYFNMDGVDGAIGTDKAYQYPFGYIANSETATTGQGAQPNAGSGNTDWTGVVWSTALTDDGWLLEAQLPMDAIGREVSTADDPLLFEISIIDQDDGDGTKTARLVWAIDINELGATNAGMWGKEEHMGEIIFDASTSIKNLSSDVFNIYPNPVINTLFINSDKLVEKVMITNLTGKTVKTLNTNTNSVSVNTADLNQGVYIISVFNKNGVYHQKVVKK